MFALIATALLSFTTAQAFTAANTVPATNISQFTKAIAPVDLEPSECKTFFTVTSIRSGSGSVTSNAANQLLLGSAGANTLTDGGSGSACMVGGAGTDTFQGITGGGDKCIVSSATVSGGTINKCAVVATRP